MGSDAHSVNPVAVACEVCLEQVPASEAQIEEANDYVMYFCGLDCYKLWRERSQRDDAREPLNNASLRGTK